MVELRIEKAARTLTALRDGGPVFVARVALGSSPMGAKLREGDCRTPEGEYFVCTRNANSNYHLALGLTYPNAQDATRGLRAKVIKADAYLDIVNAAKERKRPPWDTGMGGFIMIHGGGSDRDWTAGCVALNDEDMDAVWKLCEVGTRVTIVE